MSNTISFIQSLGLAPADADFQFHRAKVSVLEIAEDMQVQTESAAINYKSAQSFAANISKERQDDVLNSLLLAQRAATKAFPNEEDILEWYKIYHEVLNKIGWVFEVMDFRIFDVKSSLFEIEKALLEILGAALTGNQLAVALKTIQSLKALSEDDKRFVAFEKNTHSLTNGSFQVGVATEENGLLSISSSAFILNTKKNITQILFVKSSKDETTFRYNNIKATLSKSVFDDAREVIKQKLGDVRSFVADLEI